MTSAAEIFVRDFIAKEGEALRAKYGEPDAVYVPKLQAVNALFSRDVTTKSGISRSRVTEEELARLRPRCASLVPRRILDVKARTSAALGALFEFVLTGPEQAQGDAPDARYLVRETDAGMRIIAYDVACRDCAGTGRARGKRCSPCKGSGWVYADGVRAR